jgi:aryl-phospho-beta-D-glucosidase BglC (GH1 family)
LVTDFFEIHIAAGLNWVRIPIGFWAIEAINDEPFLVGTSWKYFLKAQVPALFLMMTSRTK